VWGVGIHAIYLKFGHHAEPVCGTVSLQHWFPAHVAPITELSNEARKMLEGARWAYEENRSIIASYRVGLRPRRTSRFLFRDQDQNRAICAFNLDTRKSIRLDFPPHRVSNLPTAKRKRERGFYSLMKGPGQFREVAPDEDAVPIRRVQIGIPRQLYIILIIRRHNLGRS
jgi:hypothetical protein